MIYIETHTSPWGRGAPGDKHHSSRSEGNIVVHVTVAGASRDCPTRRRRGRTEIAVGIIRCEIAAPAAAAAIEHGQARVEPLQHHLGRVFLDASLVGPFA